MAQPADQLARLQRWMQTAITHPAGLLAGLEAAARAELPGPESLEQVIAPSRQQSSLERLNIYHQAYFARLVDCLGDEFAALRAALGDELFAAFAVGYLERYPSQSYTLAQLGRQFVDFLLETRPALATDHDPHQTTWPDFLVDLAQLEWTINQVFDGPGAEQGPVLDAQALAQLSPQQWLASRLRPVPCLQLLSLRFPVHEFYRQVQGGRKSTAPFVENGSENSSESADADVVNSAHVTSGNFDRGPATPHQATPRAPQLPDDLTPRPVWLAITRQNYVVRLLPLEQGEYALLTRLCQSFTIGEALEAWQSESAETALEFRVNQLRQWFARWTAERLFAQLV